MAKILPFISGAIKEGAQKLVSIFTKAKSDAESGIPKEVVQSAEAQPDLYAPIPNEYPYTGQEAGDGGAAKLPSLPEAPQTPKLPEGGSAPETSPLPDGPNYPEAPTQTPEVGFIEPPRSTKPAMPDLPEWPKAVMESSGVSPSSYFGPSGNLNVAPHPTVSGPELGQLVGREMPGQQEAAQTIQPGQLPGMAAIEQVVPGYTRTERLLELMLLRGIPSLKPPRGP